MARHSYHVTPFVNGVLNGPIDGLISYENRSVSGEIISLSKGVFNLIDYECVCVCIILHARHIMCLELKLLFKSLYSVCSTLKTSVKQFF